MQPRDVSSSEVQTKAPAASLTPFWCVNWVQTFLPRTWFPLQRIKAGTCVICWLPS